MSPAQPQRMLFPNLACLNYFKLAPSDATTGIDKTFTGHCALSEIYLLICAPDMCLCSLRKEAQQYATTSTANYPNIGSSLGLRTNLSILSGIAPISIRNNPTRRIFPTLKLTKLGDGNLARSRVATQHGKSHLSSAHNPVTKGYQRWAWASRRPPSAALGWGYLGAARPIWPLSQGSGDLVSRTIGAEELIGTHKRVFNRRLYVAPRVPSRKYGDTQAASLGHHPVLEVCQRGSAMA
ncbi:uncharacterized protein B0H18DRAFT_1149216 [Fomitopsis serialis]|uniref:uncharacterized protein n=1 Tax=Fomitopsis serialis TaxID=139415 RepID=UPI00200787C5|nr:uncharacterized protein B0H18DRAFT_1149216 [Neoantrodia serialis]KAH9929834.1 hypothetical protein B0H18DRAFT_1149216 [Neoantrodia serialis]